MGAGPEDTCPLKSRTEWKRAEGSALSEDTASVARLDSTFPQIEAGRQEAESTFATLSSAQSPGARVVHWPLIPASGSS